MRTAYPEQNESLRGEGYRMAVVAARFNNEYVTNLLDTCLKTLEERGVDYVEVTRVPGAFEIPVAVQRLAKSGLFDAVITLGAVIRGETPHFDFLCDSTSQGLMDISLDTGIPVIFGILTCNSPIEAEERSLPAPNSKGAEAAHAAVEMANVFSSLPGA